MLSRQGIIEIYSMPDVSEIPETYMFPQNKHWM